MHAIAIASAKRPHKRWRIAGFTFLGLVALLALLLATPPARDHERVALLLLYAQQQPPPPWLARLVTYEVEETSFIISSPQGEIPCRLYTPRGIANPPALLLLHGVHHLGIDEPRMMNFARAFAASGVTVMTPQLTELIDYRIEPVTVANIGIAARELSLRLHQPRIGLMGLSFAGGLALLAVVSVSTRYLTP